MKTPHPDSHHPATGVLDCVFVDQNPEGDRSPAKICGKCGFDAAWHELKPSDYTGPHPRPGDWAKLEEKKKEKHH